LFTVVKTFKYAMILGYSIFAITMLAYIFFNNMFAQHGLFSIIIIFANIIAFVIIPYVMYRMIINVPDFWDIPIMDNINISYIFYALFYFMAFIVLFIAVFVYHDITFYSVLAPVMIMSFSGFEVYDYIHHYKKSSEGAPAKTSRKKSIIMIFISIMIALALIIFTYIYFR